MIPTGTGNRIFMTGNTNNHTNNHDIDNDNTDCNMVIAITMIMKILVSMTSPQKVKRWFRSN